MRRSAFSLLVAATIAGFGAATIPASAYAAVHAETRAVARTDSHAVSRAQASWRHQMQQLKTPGAGCFDGSYPSLAWHRVTCGKAPNVRFAPPTTSAAEPAAVTNFAAGAFAGLGSGTAPVDVGNGDDYSAQVTSGSISSATGSFPYISSGVTETGVDYTTGQTEPNTFSLQINTSFFLGSPACAASTTGDCRAWQQFVYSSTYGLVFMQYWLINYSWSQPAACPSGWTAYDSDCYESSGVNVVSEPLPPVSDLPSISLTGTVQSGGDDTAVFTDGPGQVFSVAAPDSVLDLGGIGAWTDAEFGIFGDGDATAADFSDGTQLGVETGVDNGAPTAPACVQEGFTGETNNLGFASGASVQFGPEPAVATEQVSDGGGTSGACATAPQEPVSISNPGPQSAPTNAPFSLQMQSTEADPSQALTWSAIDLPDGLSMSPSGLISGTPTTVERETSEITATDSDGDSDSIIVDWNITQGLSILSITDPGEQTVTVGSPVNLQLQGTDSTAGMSMSWTASDLPNGLSISPSGFISGTPTTAQFTWSTVNATDSTGASVSQAIAWQVNPGVGPTKHPARKLKLRLTIHGRTLSLSIVLGTGTKRQLQCSLVRIYQGRRAPGDKWRNCRTTDTYKGLKPGRYRLRVRGTGGEVTRYVTIR